VLKQSDARRSADIIKFYLICDANPLNLKSNLLGGSGIVNDVTK